MAANSKIHQADAIAAKNHDPSTKIANLIKGHHFSSVVRITIYRPLQNKSIHYQYIFLCINKALNAPGLDRLGGTYASSSSGFSRCLDRFHDINGRLCYVRL